MGRGGIERSRGGEADLSETGEQSWGPPNWGPFQQFVEISFPHPRHWGRRVTRSRLYPPSPTSRSLPVGCKHSCCTASLIASRVYSVNMPRLTPATCTLPQTCSCPRAEFPGHRFPSPQTTRFCWGLPPTPGRELEREEVWAGAWVTCPVVGISSSTHSQAHLARGHATQEKLSVSPWPHAQRRSGHQA